MILYGLRDVPEAGDDEFSVMWFDVVKFSLDMSESTAALLFADTVCCQFFEDRKHFLLHGAAFQKADLANTARISRYLTEVLPPAADGIRRLSWSWMTFWFSPVLEEASRWLPRRAERFAR